jgi:O-antigen ligase
MIKLDSIKNEDIYIALLASVAFTIPFPMLLNNIAMILLLLFWLLLCLKKEIAKFEIKSFLLLSIPYGILILGSLNSSNFNQLGTELTKSLPFLIIPLIVFTIPLKLTSRRFKMVLTAFVLGNSFVSLFLFGIIFYKVITNGFSLETLWGLTHQSLAEHVHMNAIYLSMYLAISLIILISFILKNTKKAAPKYKLALLLSSSLFIFILIFLSSRTVLFASGVTIAAIFVQHYLNKDNSTKALLKLILVGSILAVAIFYINPVLKWRFESVIGTQDPMLTNGKEEGVKMRTKLWSSALEVFEENWAFGVGSGDFKDELEKIYIKNKYRIQYRHHMNSHNQYLSYMVSNGVYGLLLFLAFLLYPAFHYIKNRLWLLAFISIMFACGFMTESYLYTNKGVVIIAFFATLMYKHSKDLIDNNSYQSNLKTENIG